MHYIYQILAAILIGTSIGALMSKRGTTLLVGALVGIILGIVAMFSPSWPPLAIGAAVFLAAQFMQRDVKANAR
ncbi:hypothetical protein [Castellaniella sp. GW247-6E4]|uniref:hypothetical protein n=1 Tax=Castellaniella sp. GW247-6E4 TaxID=3140380 RepID=UPI0033145DC2